ncbi:MAG TPA: hypothetical protein VN683_00830, partial [Acidothermaceae bacterium]|nr:hypothetical protein [Acidothermaceae bacterium]
VVPQRFASQPYAFDKHIMNAYANGLPGADVELAPQVTRELLVSVLDDVPESWLDAPEPASTVREWYVDYLLARAAAPREWLGQAS